MAVHMTMAERLSCPIQASSPTRTLSQQADDNHSTQAGSRSLSQEPAVAHISPSNPSQAVIAAFVIGFKRPRDDKASEASARISCKLKLDNKESKLLMFASKVRIFMPVHKQMLFNIGPSLKIMSKANQIQPVDAQYKISDFLRGKIEIYVYNALVSPQASGYLEDGNCVVLGILESHPKWGLTSEVKENPTHYQVVCSRVSKHFNNRRRYIKLAVDILSSTRSLHSLTMLNTIAQINELMATVNQDIPDSPRLKARDIFALVSHTTKLKGNTGMKFNSANITVQMLACFAFLRRMLLELPNGANYWKTVDKQLQDIRKSFKGQPKQATSARKILDDNLVEFGTSIDKHVDNLKSVALTNTQTDVQNAMLGIISNSTDDKSSQSDE
ncbi:hypothetical protein BC835DRAFT_1418177 [Cytidiella melzeri]|nr:hypothetical protein BC835DRAFT_1418177 [Cytidiella melzeri]